MSISRPFAYTTGSTPSGVIRVGNLLVGQSEDGIPYNNNYGGVRWWNGPDENLGGFIIAQPIPDNTQPTSQDPTTASLGFYRTDGLTDVAFIDMVESISNQTFGDVTTAQTWLSTNGYWTNFIPTHTPQILMELDSTTGITSNIWADISGNNRNGTLYNDYSVTTYNSNQVLALSGTTSFVIPIDGFGTTMDAYGLTYEVWVYPTKSSNGTIISEFGGFPGSTGWYDAQMAFVSGNINAGVYPNTFNPTGYLQGPSFSVNTWYNIVLTYDVTSGNEKMYVNGTLIGTTNGTKANPGGTTLVLGRPDSPSGAAYIGGATGYFKGFVGFWRVWDGAINQTQVTTFYNQRKSLYGL